MRPSDTKPLSIAAADDKPIRPASEPARGYRLQDGKAGAFEAKVAAEVPVALAYNGVSHVVMMATPNDLADFAIGFSLSEGIFASLDELRELAVEDGGDGIEVQLEIAERAYAN